MWMLNNVGYKINSIVLNSFVDIWPNFQQSEAHLKDHTFLYGWHSIQSPQWQPDHHCEL